MSEARWEDDVQAFPGPVWGSDKRLWRFLEVELIAATSGQAAIRWSGPLPSTPGASAVSLAQYDAAIFVGQRLQWDAGSEDQRRISIADGNFGALTVRVRTDTEPIMSSPVSVPTALVSGGAAVPVVVQNPAAGPVGPVQVALAAGSANAPTGGGSQPAIATYSLPPPAGAVQSVPIDLQLPAGAVATLVGANSGYVPYLLGLTVGPGSGLNGANQIRLEDDLGTVLATTGWVAGGAGAVWPLDFRPGVRVGYGRGLRLHNNAGGATQVQGVLTYLVGTI